MRFSHIVIDIERLLFHLSMPLVCCAHYRLYHNNISRNTHPNKIQNKKIEREYVQTKHNLRLNQSWSIAFSASWCILYGCQFCVNIAIQFVIQIEITLILQRCAACCTFETIDMKILIFDANKNTTKIDT